MAAPAAGQSQVQRSQNASLLYLQTSSAQSDRYLATTSDFRTAALSLCRHMQVRLQWARKRTSAIDCLLELQRALGEHRSQLIPFRKALALRKDCNLEADLYTQKRVEFSVS